MDYDKVDYSRYYIKNRDTYMGISDNDANTHIEYTGNKKQRKKSKVKPKDKHNLKGTLLTICIIIVAFVTVLLVADSIKGGYVISELETLIRGDKVVTHSYYGVETRVFDNIESARRYSNEIRAKEGAGYVINDEGYRVLVEVYSKEADAESIAKKLKLDGENAKVYKFDIRKVDYLVFPDKTRTATKTAISYNDRIYSKLYAIGVDLVKGNIDENSARMRIKGIRDETNNVITEFLANIDEENDNALLLRVKAELRSVEAMLDNLQGDKVKRPNLLADIRYTNCLIINAYRGLTQELN